MYKAYPYRLNNNLTLKFQYIILKQYSTILLLCFSTTTYLNPYIPGRWRPIQTIVIPCCDESVPWNFILITIITQLCNLRNSYFSPNENKPHILSQIKHQSNYKEHFTKMSAKFWPFHWGLDELSHWGLVTPYGDIDLKSTLAQVIACCLMAPSYYLNQCCLITSEVLWHSPEGNLTGNTQYIYPWYEF